MQAENVTAAKAKKRTYKKICDEAEHLEADGKWAEAASRWAEAKAEARRVKRESGTAFARQSEAETRARAVASASAPAAPTVVEMQQAVEEALETQARKPSKPVAELLKKLTNLFDRSGSNSGFSDEEVADLLANETVVKCLKVLGQGMKPLNGGPAADAAALLYRAGYTAKDATKKPAANVEALVKAERARAKQNGVKVGDTLQHVSRGKVLAACKYRGERDWVYKGKSYTSISAAANAAAEDLGMKSRSLNGWWFWGIEKREP